MPSVRTVTPFEGTLFRYRSGATAILQLHSYLLVAIILLYLLLPAPVLLFLKWQYLGGGSEVEKIHPATYLLVIALCGSLIVDRHFRLRVITRVASDTSILLFSSAVILTATYAYLAKGASIAPFVDTFLAAILVSVVLTCVAIKPLLFFRRLIVIFFIGSILLIFWETAANRNILAELLMAGGQSREIVGVLTPLESSNGVSRVSALFGHPLDAALLLGTYCIANLVSIPVRFSRVAIARLALSALAYVAIFPTGGRTALVVTSVLVVLYAIYCGIGWGVTGSINKAGATLAILGAIVLVPLLMILYNAGFFDPMLARFESDYGSALSRDYALDILGQSSGYDLWFGLPVQEILGFQHSFGLIAIEISWINFILVGGLITAIPLFVTYFLFLFRAMRRSCTWGIYFTSLLVFIVTAASNGIWSKTTGLTTSLAVAICFLRRDLQPAAYIRAIPPLRRRENKPPASSRARIEQM